jgi:hypothetical protein
MKLGECPFISWSYLALGGYTLLLSRFPAGPEPPPRVWPALFRLRASYDLTNAVCSPSPLPPAIFLEGRVAEVRRRCSPGRLRGVYGKGKQ